MIPSRSDEISDEIQRRLTDNLALTQAIRQAVRQAVLAHKQAGNTVATWRDGKVVLLAPEEIVLPEEPD